MALAARDTIPSAVAEDSIQRLARQLAEQSQRLDSVQAHADSLDIEMRAVRAAREVRVAGGAVHFVPKRGASEEFMKMRVGSEPVPDLSNPVAMQRGLARSAARVDSALARYYPNLANDASATTLIWFVADSSGKILHTARDDDKPFFMSTQLATERFPDVDPRAIDFVSIRKWSVGTRHIAVAWIGLKR